MSAEVPTLTMDYPTWRARMRRLIVHDYGGGLHGTCYECPYASPPLERDGREARWSDIANDPTEAYFRCSLPLRDNEAIAWGEYAPCTEEEWFEAHMPEAETFTIQPLHATGHGC